MRWRDQLIQDMLVVFTLAETLQSATGVPGSLLWMHPLCFLFTITLISDEAKLIGLNHNQASWPAAQWQCPT